VHAADAEGVNDLLEDGGLVEAGGVLVRAGRLEAPCTGTVIKLVCLAVRLEAPLLVVHGVVEELGHVRLPGGGGEGGDGHTRREHGQAGNAGFPPS